MPLKLASTLARRMLSMFGARSGGERRIVAGGRVVDRTREEFLIVAEGDARLAIGLAAVGLARHAAVDNHCLIGGTAHIDRFLGEYGSAVVHDDDIGCPIRFAGN